MDYRKRSITSYATLEAHLAGTAIAFDSLCGRLSTVATVTYKGAVTVKGPCLQIPRYQRRNGNFKNVFSEHGMKLQSAKRGEADFQWSSCGLDDTKSLTDRVNVSENWNQGQTTRKGGHDSIAAFTLSSALELLEQPHSEKTCWCLSRMVAAGERRRLERSSSMGSRLTGQIREPFGCPQPFSPFPAAAITPCGGEWHTCYRRSGTGSGWSPAEVHSSIKSDTIVALAEAAREGGLL